MSFWREDWISSECLASVLLDKLNRLGLIGYRYVVIKVKRKMCSTSDGGIAIPYM